MEDGTHTNKLAVVEKDGAGYAKHVDNVMGANGGDARKLTAIYYLNPRWNAHLGGHFRVWDADIVGAKVAGPPSSDGTARVAPRGDRLVVFWSDGLVHDVEPSRIASSTDDRWALTAWLIAKEPDADPSLARGVDPWIDFRHFDAPASELVAQLVAPARRSMSRTIERLYRRLAGSSGK
jgi:Rps23 Pro-64 3,4-dihydroxylase Tpa1-like proline 4-hydroxylase